jgi:putative glutathione S-transferase
MLNWASNDGSFKRQQSSFRNVIGRDAGFQPEPNRYHIIISHACPWAHRVAIVRNLKGLQQIIPIHVVDFYMGPDGWSFPNEQIIPGMTNPVKYLKDIYHFVDPDYNARYTVPVLWDSKSKMIVNNESSEIIRMMNSEFDQWSSNPGITYYPENLRDKIDEVNEWVYSDINNGVYKTGFATKQEPYEENCTKLFDSLQKVDLLLKSNSFLVGDTFTEADIRLFTTIVRFDPVYHTHFKCNRGSISHDFPNILRWCRKIYQMKGISDTVNLEHIKKHYYLSHPHINPFQIVPLWNGPDLSLQE